MQVTVQLRSRVLVYFKSLVGINFQGFFILLGTLLGTVYKPGGFPLFGVGFSLMIGLGVGLGMTRPEKI
ncbi:MAG TPA: hypothetical protein VIM07_08800 [Chitinophagaceae bacterium]